MGEGARGRASLCGNFTKRAKPLWGKTPRGMSLGAQ
jgi:hypothetical protein